MRDKICHALTKKIKRALKLQRDMNGQWMGSEELGKLLLMWQAQLVEEWGVNSNFMFSSNDL